MVAEDADHSLVVLIACTRLCFPSHPRWPAQCDRSVSQPSRDTNWCAVDLGICPAVPAVGEQTDLVQTSYGLVPIGWVQSALKVLDDAPNQRDGAPRAWIRFDEQVAEGAKDLRPGDEIVVLTWLHLSPRDELSTHPQGDPEPAAHRRVQHLLAQSAEPHRPAPCPDRRARRASD